MGDTAGWSQRRAVGEASSPKALVPQEKAVESFQESDESTELARVRMALHAHLDAKASGRISAQSLPEAPSPPACTTLSASPVSLAKASVEPRLGHDSSSSAICVLELTRSSLSDASVTTEMELPSQL